MNESRLMSVDHFGKLKIDNILEPASFNNAKDPSKCFWMPFKKDGYKNPYVLVEEIFADEVGDMPMDKALVITTPGNRCLNRYVGLQCIFIDEVRGNGYVFKTVFGNNKTFIKFGDIMNVYVVHGWMMDNSDFAQSRIN